MRAGRSICGVVDRYAHYQAAGDQVCERTVAALDINSYKFGVSPPFFDPSRSLLRDDETAVDDIKASKQYSFVFRLTSIF
jgi:hypothetical protein